MKDLHDLINELGASLDDDDKLDSMMTLNQLYLNGYDDLWICIAFIRVVDRDDFNKNKYLFRYQPFIDEVNELKTMFNAEKRFNKDCQIDAVYRSSDNITTDYDRALIEEYIELFNDGDDEEVIADFRDYLYMKYCFSYTEIFNCNINKYKNLIRRTNARDIADF